MKTVEYELFKSTVASSKSVKETLSKLGIGRKLTQKLIKKYDLDVSHFDKTGAYKRRKYNLGTKVCPNCNKNFTTKIGHKKEKTFCCNRCCALSREIPSMTKYRQSVGLEQSTERSEYYRRLCFESFEQKCQICGFDEYVEVHHIDGNRLNNIQENLIPLCANHHVLVHKQKTHEKIQNQIDEIMLKYFPNTYSDIIPQTCFFGYKGYYTTFTKDNKEVKSKISIALPHQSNMPPKSELEKIIWDQPAEETGKIYGVSGSSIVNWCKKYNIKKPPRGYWKKQKSLTQNNKKMCPICKKFNMTRESKNCLQCYKNKRSQKV